MPTESMVLLTERDVAVAWAAGLFDGEGHIGTSKYTNNFKRKDGRPSPPYYHIRISVEMTDRLAIERLVWLFGGNITTRKRGKWKRQYGWKRAGRPVEKPLRELLPYLVTKRTEALIALDWFDIPRYQWGATQKRAEIAARLKACKVGEV